MKMKRIVPPILLIVILTVTLYPLQRLFMPKYMDEILEGSFIEEYYQETTPHDVIVIGDCEAYENISPITLWEDYGITSYVRGSPQQLIWQSYYLLKETLTIEKPKMVILSVLSMKYDKPQRESYNRLTLDGMRLSAIKLQAVRASLMQDEHLLDYIFPILRFHGRLNQLTKSDFTYYFQKRKVTHNGYYMRVDVLPANGVPKPRRLSHYQFSDVCYDYLNRIADLCEKNGVDFVLIKSPCLYPHWYEEWDEQMVDYAKERNLTYLNLDDLSDEIGIDWETDTYDGGLHMNLNGAEKLTRYLGRRLAEDYSLPDQREVAELSAVWEEKTRFYYDMKDAQLTELENYGHLKSFGGSPEDSKEALK